MLKGLSAVESMAKLREILQEAGVEGEPTLEKCKKAKKKLEVRQDMEGIDTSNIILSSSRPKRSAPAPAEAQRVVKRPKHDDDDSEEASNASGSHSGESEGGSGAESESEGEGDSGRDSD